MIYVTGDTHGDFVRIQNFCVRFNTNKNDVLIILGDAGINFYLNKSDAKKKHQLNDLPITLFCIHGNHEARPETIDEYTTKTWNNGTVYYEEKYPNILFAKDGEIYDLGGKSVFVCGGAYSVDKYYRAWRAGLRNPSLYTIDIANAIEKLASHNTLVSESKNTVDTMLETISPKTLLWWKDEQPSTFTKQRCEESLTKHGWKIDVVLTHTCPKSYEPIEVFLPGLNQDNIDKSTEQWLDTIEQKLDYKKWYCGHWHTDKKIDNMEFLFETIKEFC